MPPRIPLRTSSVGVGVSNAALLTRIANAAKKKQRYSTQSKPQLAITSTRLKGLRGKLLQAARRQTSRNQILSRPISFNLAWCRIIGIQFDTA